jgi:2-C-methyl-D-erythritol 4-phosphate cytidylyltransferase
MYVTAIVLAAGKGLRLKSKISKPLIVVNSKPLIIYCLNALSNHPYIKDIIVVANPKNLKKIYKVLRQYRIGKIKDIILGGKLRQDSVVKGLKAIDSRTELVLIHDAVRPFIDKEMISSVIKAAKIYGAAIVAVPVKATIKEVHSPQSTVHSKKQKRLTRYTLHGIQNGKFM